jgi:hypothetical protein
LLAIIYKTKVEIKNGGQTKSKKSKIGNRKLKNGSTKNDVKGKFIMPICFFLKYILLTHWVFIKN